MDRQIKGLEQELRIKINEAEREQKRYFAKHHKLYEDYHRAIAHLDARVTRYYELSSVELKVKDAIIE